MSRSLPVLAFAVALAGACGEQATPDALGFAPELLGVRGGGPWVEPRFHEAVAKARWLVADPARDVPRLPLSIELSEIGGAGAEPFLRLEAEGHPPEAWRTRLGEIEAIIEVAPEGAELDLAAHGGLALDRAIAVIDAKIGLSLDGREAVAAILGAEDPQIVILGLDWVIDHRGRAYADDVARLVDHPDDRVALRAVEALGVVGEARHAHALVRLPRLADRAHAQRIYDALARLGGEEARGFLEFAARNEDDPLMMDVAADALKRVVAADPSADAGARDHRAGRGHR